MNLVLHQQFYQKEPFTYIHKLIFFPVDPCAKAPCKNGGRCSIKSVNVYSCKCTSSFSGKNCQNFVQRTIFQKWIPSAFILLNHRGKRILAVGMPICLSMYIVKLFFNWHKSYCILWHYVLLQFCGWETAVVWYFQIDLVFLVKKHFICQRTFLDAGMSPNHCFCIYFDLHFVKLLHLIMFLSWKYGNKRNCNVALDF